MLYYIFVNILSIFIKVTTELCFKIVSKYLFVCLLTFCMPEYVSYSVPNICALLFLFNKKILFQ